MSIEDERDRPVSGPGPDRPAGDEPVRRADALRVRVLHVLRNDPPGMAAAAFLVVLLAVAVAGPTLLGPAALTPNLPLRFVAPFSVEHGWQYVLGSDALGRSFAARLVAASRTTLIISGLAVLAALLVGSVIGTVVGYVGGWADSAVMRTADVMLAFPALLLALIVIYTLGPGLLSLVFVLAVTRIALYTRVARAETLAVRERLFVRAAQALGATPMRIVRTQIAPVVAPSLIALATLEFALVVLAESALSFLGLGMRDPDITWGGLIAEGRNYLRDAWWVALLPGLAITVTAISVNLLADVVRRARVSD